MRNMLRRSLSLALLGAVAAGCSRQVVTPSGSGGSGQGSTNNSAASSGSGLMLCQAECAAAGACNHNPDCVQACTTGFNPSCADTWYADVQCETGNLDTQTCLLVDPMKCNKEIEAYSNCVDATSMIGSAAAGG